MRGRILIAGVLAALLALAAVASAGAEKATVVRSGQLVMKLNGGVAPKRLPRAKLAPVTLSASANLSTADGSHPPAARKVTIDFDRHGTINAEGLPVCRPGLLQSRDTGAAERACRKAIVGKGSTAVEVKFPEQPAFTSAGPLVLFNGGVQGRVTTMYIHAYVDVPAPTAIVTRVEIRKIHKGRYGTRAIATIPKIAGGAGSVTRFGLHIHRIFRRQGKRQSYLLARCANGRFYAHAKVDFLNGTSAAGTILRTCRKR